MKERPDFEKHGLAREDRSPFAGELLKARLTGQMLGGQPIDIGSKRPTLKRAHDFLKRRALSPLDTCLFLVSATCFNYQPATAGRFNVLGIQILEQLEVLDEIRLGSIAGLVGSGPNALAL
ncbi:hypothetical protein [Pontivivens ytuae]|uniref:Uncharacterized protein n=1 Tax=Pontivivens ytuae TaxID=2789856 RepID=A0A7S9LTC3_9RHOB|nr:hypothetical protein [Pontivivens ytuae]QPH54947.1 hypothetical protein I0K15_04060 [Pontivivens ytuae]